MQDDVSVDSYYRMVSDHRFQSAVNDARKAGQQLADAFHRYQLALADRQYENGNPNPEVTARIDSAFAECLRLTHQIREGM